MAMATMSGCSLQQMKLDYFSSISPMARKIMQERERVKQQHGAHWERMSAVEQDEAIDTAMMDPAIRARYAMHRVDREDVVCYPKLLLQTGQKTVHFGEEDITWQDEHSAPFSWETKSQLDFSLSSPVCTEQGSAAPQGEPRPPKLSQSSQLPKVPQPGKASNGEQSGAARKDEESSFWKLSAERSRLEGEEADFQSLTPSQIKSMEKGEKPLPSYLRQESEEPPPPPRAAKPRAPRPPPPPPPTGSWERAQSTLPSVSNMDDVFTPGPNPPKSPVHFSAPPKEPERAESPPVSTSPTFSQFNTSNSILKTGFDFLDNW